MGHSHTERVDNMSNASMASNKQNLSTGLVATGSALAMRGFDPVAYHTSKMATPGSAANAAVYDGATYYFQSDENKKKFEADPPAYLPSFGGFCAYGVSVGKKFDGDPQIWKIVNGRLHLNLNQEIHKAFLADLEGSIKKADQTWPSIAARPVAEL
jgi:YHS domain-containing protein